MFLTVSAKNTNYVSFTRRQKMHSSAIKKPHYFSEDSKRLMSGLVFLAGLGAASMGYSYYKTAQHAARLKEIKYIGQSIANHAVRNSNTRGKDAVDTYKKHIADKKLSSLKYKMENGMFIGKTKEAMAQIEKNLKQLEIDAL